MTSVSEPWLASPARGFVARCRQGLRVAGLVAATAVCYPATYLGAGLLRRWPHRRAAWQRGVFGAWSRSLLRIFGIRLAVLGPPPRPPFLLVANHLSWVDILVLGATTGATFVARADIEGWPLAGPVCQAVDTIFIDRASKRDLLRVAALVEARLAADAGVVLFAEGTTSRGDRILPFKPALLEVAAQSDAAVHYATLAYRTPSGEPPASQAVCWWGDAPFAPHALRLLALPRVDARLTFGPAPIRDADRKRLAARLREAMEAIFEPTA